MTAFSPVKALFALTPLSTLPPPKGCTRRCYHGLLVHCVPPILIGGQSSYEHKWSPVLDAARLLPRWLPATVAVELCPYDGESWTATRGAMRRRTLHGINSPSLSNMVGCKHHDPTPHRVNVTQFRFGLFGPSCPPMRSIIDGIRRPRPHFGLRRSRLRCSSSAGVVLSTRVAGRGERREATWPDLLRRANLGRGTFRHASYDNPQAGCTSR